MRRWYLFGLSGICALAGSARLAEPATGHARSSCASAAIVQTRLRAFLPGLSFRADSSGLQFVPDSMPASDLDRYARRIAEPRTCRLAHRAYRHAIGAPPSDDAAEPGTVSLVRVGSYYLIAESEDMIVLTTSSWRVLDVIGLDND